MINFAKIIFLRISRFFAYFAKVRLREKSAKPQFVKISISEKSDNSQFAKISPCEITKKSPFAKINVPEKKRKYDIFLDVSIALAVRALMLC